VKGPPGEAETSGEAPAAAPSPDVPEERGRGRLRLWVQTGLMVPSSSFPEAVRAQGSSAGEASSDIPCVCC